MHPRVSSRHLCGHEAPPLLTICTTIVTCILMTITGCCGDAGRGNTGSTDVLSLTSRRSVDTVLVQCSRAEIFLFSIVLLSDVCRNGEKEVKRQVNTSMPLMCSDGYGEVNGTCLRDCSYITSGNASVTDSVTVTTNKEPQVNCIPGFYGYKCEEKCDPGCYGNLCRSQCLCENNSTCDSVTGECTCTDGWTGANCDTECSNGSFGTNCSRTCSCDSAVCHHSDGCMCRETTTGQQCDTVCRANTFGASCSEQCLCFQPGTSACDVLNGTCDCQPGWTGNLCEDLCPVGTYGARCQQSCECTQKEFCIPTNGSCLCWDLLTGADCTTSEAVTPTTIVPPPVPHINLLNVGIIVGAGVLVLAILMCCVLAYHRRSKRMFDYKCEGKDSTLKIVHADLPPREDLTKEKVEGERRGTSRKEKRKSHQDPNLRPKAVLNLPPRTKSTAPMVKLGFQRYDSLDEEADGGSLDMNELTRHSYVNMKDENISKFSQGHETESYEILNKANIQSPLQDYEVCVKADLPYENVPPKKRRSVLGSLKQFVTGGSRQSNRKHLEEDPGPNSGRASFVTFQKPSN